MCTVSLNGVQLFTAALQGKLLAVDTVATTTPTVMAAEGSSGANTETISLWHKRMGHANQQLLQSMMSREAVIGMGTSTSTSTTVCEGCVMGKHAREPFR